MIVDNNEVLWFFSQDRIIYKFENEEWTEFDSDNHPFSDHWNQRIVTDADNNLVTYYDDGLAIFSNEEWELIPLGFNGDIPGSLHIAPNGDIWMNQSDKTLIYDGLTIKEISVFNSPITSNFYYQLYFAENQDVWMLNSHGVTRMKPIFRESRNKIGGIAFYDHNMDGILNPQEDARLANQKIVHHLTNEISFTNSSGGYAFSLFNNTQSRVENVPSKDWNNVSPRVIDYSFLGQDIKNLDFALHNDNLDPDLSIDLVSTPAICNDQITFWITVKNLGLENQTGTVRLNFDDLFTFKESNRPLLSSSANSVLLGFEDLRYTETFTFVISLLTPNEDFLGEIFSFDTEVVSENLSITKDLELPVELFCSYDPNDKLVSASGEIEDIKILPDAQLTYTIRFQNLGNFLARKVVLVDTLDPALDVNTFEILSSSHEVATTIFDGNVVFFKYDEINLPYEEIDSAGSNGYVKYRISLNPEIPNGTHVYNSATIYFDNNAGIETNTIENIVVDNLSSTKKFLESESFLVLPNPNDGQFIIDSKKSIQNNPVVLSVYNLQGNQIVKDFEAKLPARINLSNSGLYLVYINYNGYKEIIRVSVID